MLAEHQISDLDIQHQVASIPTARDQRFAQTSFGFVKATVLRLPLLTGYTDFCNLKVKCRLRAAKSLLSEPVGSDLNPARVHPV